MTLDSLGPFRPGGLLCGGRRAGGRRCPVTSTSSSSSRRTKFRSDRRPAGSAQAERACKGIRPCHQVLRRGSPERGELRRHAGRGYFGIHDDDAWYCEPLTIDTECPHAMLPGYVSHSIAAPSLMDQLAAAKLTWKGYFEDLPAPGSLDIFSSGRETRLRCAAGALRSQAQWLHQFRAGPARPGACKKIVPLSQLAGDLAADAAPNYAHIVLNQCNDMHGLWRRRRLLPSGRGAVIRRGDAAIGQAVDRIMAAPLWAKAATWPSSLPGTRMAGIQPACRAVAVSSRAAPRTLAAAISRLSLLPITAQGTSRTRSHTIIIRCCGLRRRRSGSAITLVSPARR